MAFGTVGGGASTVGCGDFDFFDFGEGASVGGTETGSGFLAGSAAFGGSTDLAASCFCCAALAF